MSILAVFYYIMAVKAVLILAAGAIGAGLAWGYCAWQIGRPVPLAWPLVGLLGALLLSAVYVTQGAGQLAGLVMAGLIGYCAHGAAVLMGATQWRAWLSAVLVTFGWWWWLK